MDTYEKKYKGALERAKDYYKANQKLGDSDENEVLSDIFPELKESSEEKVRKEIIKLVKFYYGSSLALKHTVSKDEMVAWLERQKTSEEAIKYLEENHSPSEISDFQEAMNIAVAKAYDRGRRDAEKQGEKSPFNKERLMKVAKPETFEEKIEHWQRMRDIAEKRVKEWLEKQGQQPKKVSIWKHWKDGIAGGAEGEQIFLTKIGRIYSISSCLGCECDYIELSELDNLLSDKQEPKPKWGEEDERHYTTIIKALHSSGAITPIDMELAEKWFKSLKKMMEEQQ